MAKIRAESYAGLSALESQKQGMRDDRFFRSLSAREAIRQNLEQQRNQAFSNTLGLAGFLHNLRNQRVQDELSRERGQQERDLALLTLATQAREGDRRNQGNFFEAAQRHQQQDRQFNEGVRRANFSQDRQNFNDAARVSRTGVPADEVADALGVTGPRAEMLKRAQAIEAENEAKMFEAQETAVTAANKSYEKASKAVELVTKELEGKEKLTPQDRLTLLQTMAKSNIPVPANFSTMAMDTLLAYMITYKQEVLDTTQERFSRMGVYFDDEANQFEAQPMPRTYGASEIDEGGGGSAMSDELREAIEFIESRL